MTISQMLDGGYTIIKRRPRAVLVAVAVFVVPVQVLAVFLQRDALQSNSLVTVFSGVGDTTQSDDLFLVSALAAALLQSLLLFFVGAVVSVFVSGWYAGRDPSGREAVTATARRGGALFLAWLILLPAKVAGLALACLVVPPFAVAAFFAVTAPALMMEGLGPFAAIKRSATLVAKRFWPCLGLVILAALVQQILQFVFAGVPSLIGPLFPSPLNWIVVAVGQSAAALITLTGLVGASVLLYLDLRVRTEGLDIEMRARRAMAAAQA